MRVVISSTPPTELPGQAADESGGDVGEWDEAAVVGDIGDDRVHADDDEREGEPAMASHIDEP